MIILSLYSPVEEAKGHFKHLYKNDVHFLEIAVNVLG